MAESSTSLAALYRDASNAMRNADGLQPQDAFEELLKYLFLKQAIESAGARARATSGVAGVAQQLRAAFVDHLQGSKGGAKDLWNDVGFRLSDVALVRLHELFSRVSLTAQSLDVRAAALREFLGADLRRGLGIFLTPDAVVRAVVEAVAPPVGATVYDPACGAGTFLIETLRHWRSLGEADDSWAVHGSDVNARMLVLAELNLHHLPGVVFHGRLLDAIRGPEPPLDQLDYIFTNPPFGVYVDPHSVAAGDFSTHRHGSTARIQSEVLFIERCLRWLKPGGVLAIVVPRSVLTNHGLADARAAIDDLASLFGVLNLPPETFASTGAQVTTSVLFLRRHAASHETRGGDTEVPVVEITNVGYDSAGRARAGGQLEGAARDLRQAVRLGRGAGMARMVRLPSGSPLAAFGRSTGQRAVAGTRRLASIIALADTGRTPARAAYVDDGIFMVKVGNLSGQGIDWCPRERNFAKPSASYDRLLLAPGDLVLTSSAHVRKYIAQKVDIIQSVPDFVGGRAAFVGEVLRLRLRADAGVDPYELLAFLRSPRTRAVIQEMISGQTAHLRPSDLLELPIPEIMANDELVDILRQETELARKLNLLSRRQRELLVSV